MGVERWASLSTPYGSSQWRFCFNAACARSSPSAWPRQSRRLQPARAKRGRSFVQSPGLPSRNHCVEQVSLTPFMVRVALCPLIQNSMSASA